MAAALVRRSASITCFFRNHYCNVSASLSHLFSTSSTEKPISNPVPSFTPDFFIHKFDFSHEIASKLASASARMHKPQNPYLLLSFLKQTGFSNANLERIVKHHTRVLSACVETNVKPKFKIFHDLGLSADEVTQIVACDFSILHRAENTIIHKLSVLKGVLGSNENVIKLIKRFPGLFRANPEKTMLPNIDFLKSCGIQIEQINSLIYTFPNLFLRSPENMRRCVDKADEMGVLRSSRMFIHAVEAIRHMPDDTLELKLKSLQDLGFSEDDISRVFRSYPALLHLSTKKIKEVIEVLLETGKYDMSCIVKCPLSLMFSVEKRYKPRLLVLKVLEEKNLINKWPILSTLGNMSNKIFFDKFVDPNINEVGNMFIAHTADDFRG